MAEDSRPALDRLVQERIGEKLRESLEGAKTNKLPSRIETLVARLRNGSVDAKPSESRR